MLNDCRAERLVQDESGRVVGLMVRHCRGRRDLKQRIEDGQIGEILRISVDCGPCMKRTCPLQTHRCMVELSLQQVLDAAHQLMQSSS